MITQPAKKRITYIDIAKGVLMLTLMFRHMLILGSDLSEVGAPFFDKINSSSVFFACFRMQCFFIITGYCTNFDKPFKQFLWQNFRVLILVGLAYEAIMAGVSCVLNHGAGIMASIHTLIYSFFIHGNCYWFLGALFLSKIFYYVLHKLGVKNCYIFLVSLVVMCVAVYIFDAYHGVVASDDHHFRPEANVWHVFHAMYLLPFLSVGRAFWQHNWFESRWCMPVGILFVLVVLPLSFLDVSLPSLTYYIDITSYWEIPIHFVLVLSGTCFIIQFSKCIVRSRFFAMFGRESLLVYTLHAKMLGITMGFLFCIVPPDSWKHVSMLVFAAMAIVLAMLLVSIWIKNWLKHRLGA